MLFHLTDHCKEFNLLPDNQSAYRPYHSCETALLSLCNDALKAMETQEILSVCILDLSTAFDTVDHGILIEILSKKFGLAGKALHWYEEYLQPRMFKVCVENAYSEPKQLHFSVPQGSASGAFIFICYIAPLEQIMPKDITLNGFADNHSLRKPFKPINHEESCNRDLLEKTLIDTKSWMTSMRLKLNEEKTRIDLFWI